MKIVKLFASLFLTMMICSAFTIKSKDSGLYMVGVSASFSDSLVYFTDVQFVDSIALDKETKLLPMRSQYSEQLDLYLEQTKGMENRTCFIYFDEKKSNLEKVIKKMKEEYKKGGKSIVREVGPEFKFTKAIDY